MKDKIYYKVTKEQPFRKFRLFLKKHFDKQRFFAILAKLGLVREVKRFETFPFIHNDLLNKVRLVSEKIVTDRGVFNLSYRGEGTAHNHKWWYESKFKGHKRLYTVMDVNDVYVHIQAHSECEEFEVRLDPFNSVRVQRHSPYVTVVLPDPKPFTFPNTGDPISKIETEVIEIDFMKARFNIEVKQRVPHTKDAIDLAVKECLQKATAQVRNYIESREEDINERLTGITGDGKILSPDGQPLLENHLCNRCSFPVFKHTAVSYTVWCIRCGNSMLYPDVIRVDPNTYRGVLENCKRRLYDLVKSYENRS